MDSHTVGPLGLPLGQPVQVAELGRHEEAGRGVGAGRDTRAAADAGRRVHRLLGVRLGHEHRVRLGCAPGPVRDVAPGLDDAIEGAPVDDEVLDDRKRARTPRLDRETIPVPEVPQVELAGRRRGQRAVGRPSMTTPQAPQIPSRQSFSNAIGSSPRSRSSSLTASSSSRNDMSGLTSRAS
jgi:hypothetical protein